jgi:DNA-directed RNA polymerase subunit L
MAKARSKMDIRILEKTKDELRIEISGEGHTFCNLLQKALLEDDTVEIGGYSLEHPLISNPVVHVIMKPKRKPEKRPETALKEAAEKVLHRSHEFRLSFDKAIKEWQNQ